MSKGNLTSLGLREEPKLDPVKAEEMPEERGQRKSYQPGHFLLRLPSDLSSVWTKVEKKQYDAEGNVIKGEDGKPLTNDRIAAVFDDKDILEIVNSPHGRYNGEYLECRISGSERARGKDGPKLSALQYLIRGLEGGVGVIPSPTDFQGTGQALQKHAGKLFEADWEISGRCNADRQAYFIDPDTGSMYPGVDPNTQQEIPGCGEGAVYQSKWPTHAETIKIGDTEKTITVYDDYALCPECSAVLYPFGELVRFKAAEAPKS